MSTRYMHAAALVTVLGASWTAAQNKPSLRLISPPDGSVITLGGKLDVKVAGTGDYLSLGVIGEASAHSGEPWFFRSLIPPELGQPVARPWNIAVDLPLKMPPGLYSLKAAGTAMSKEEIESKKISIDLEPSEIPPLTFSQRALTMPVGGCVKIREASPHTCSATLSISGTYPEDPGRTEISFNESTKIRYVSEASSIATMRDGAIIGVSAGSTKIVVQGKYAIIVTVVKK